MKTNEAQHKLVGLHKNKIPKHIIHISYHKHHQTTTTTTTLQSVE